MAGGRGGTLAALGEVRATGREGPVTWHKMGAGWSWLRTQPGDHARAAREGWEQVKRDLAAETFRLVVLDEFTYPMASGAVDVDEVLAAQILAGRPSVQHVVVTGRRATRPWSTRPTWSPR